MADFLRLRQADGLAGSYAFIVKASPDSSDLAYMSQANDMEYQLDSLNQRYPNRILHQLGSQCYNPKDGRKPNFVHYLSSRAFKGDLQHAVGFYLNPRMESQVSLFIDLVDEMEAGCLNFAAKTINRCREAERLAGASMRKIRTEGLVVTATNGDADQVLGIILNRYRQLPDVFANRPVPTLAARLASGIAVATRLDLKGSGGQRESFNKNRSKLLDEAHWHLERQDFLPPGAIPTENHIELFRLELQETAFAWGIDPHNLAFEKR